MIKTDLNLLVIFDALMTEQSVTAAAERLSMTQPSVSNALARIRHVYNDPIFVKQGRGIKPTPFAIELWQNIAPALNHIQQTVNPESFIPDQANRTFRIALTDGLTRLYWLPLRKILESNAPNINIHAVPILSRSEQLLHDAEVDLVIGRFDTAHPKLISKTLLRMPFVVVMNPDHPLAEQPLTIERFIAAEQLLVSLSGDATGAIDIKLSEMGLSRRVAMTTNSFYGAMELVGESQLLSVLPYPVVLKAIQNKELIYKPLPFIVPCPIMSNVFHIRNKNDQGLAWLIKQFEQINQRYIEAIELAKL